MSRNIRSLILFFVLLCIVLFLAGFRYGKFVERADKSYSPPTTPTQAPPEPSPTTKPFAVVPYTGKMCGVSFLYPNYLDEQPISTQEAVLSKNVESIHVVCDKAVIETTKQERKTASPSANITVVNQRIPIFENNNLSSIIVINAHTGQSILLEVTTNLTKLVFPSIEFVK